MMVPIREFIGQDLLWTPKAALKKQYDLVAMNTVLATLDMSNWTHVATAITAELSFTLKPEGFFKQQVMVRATESGPILATYTRGWTGGVLQCANDHMFKWDNANVWGTKRVWKDQTGTPLIFFQSSPWTSELMVKVEPEAIMHSEHPLLVILGLYISILGNRNTSTHTTTGA